MIPRLRPNQGELSGAASSRWRRSVTWVVAAVLVAASVVVAGAVGWNDWLPAPPLNLPPTLTPGPYAASGNEQRDCLTSVCGVGAGEIPTSPPPTLEDFWDGRAGVVVDVPDTGLPMGESDTLLMPNGELWSYMHASFESAGVFDQCGDPVPFPGCVVLFRSRDGGVTFVQDEPHVCLLDCRSCPCRPAIDHVQQQQYPRVVRAGDLFIMAYEYQGRIMLTRSADGLAWAPPEEVPGAGIWQSAGGRCPPHTIIGIHPFLTHEYDCLSGGPPGLFVVDRRLYVFLALGQNPGALGCFAGRVDGPVDRLRVCRNNPLFSGAGDYGPLDVRGAAANAYFDFRTISAADVLPVDDRYYALYEGIRGPGPGDPGDTQFGLGLARNLTGAIDGPWEKYPGNPILADLPGNIGLGHADLLQIDGHTILYTSLDGKTRSRLRLVWK